MIKLHRIVELICSLALILYPLANRTATDSDRISFIAFCTGICILAEAAVAVDRHITKENHDAG